MPENSSEIASLAKAFYDGKLTRRQFLVILAVLSADVKLSVASILKAAESAPTTDLAFQSGTLPKPEDWFLQFSSENTSLLTLEKRKLIEKSGLPWGDGTEMANREKLDKKPWDINCKVTTLIGGYAAMKNIRDALETAIKEACKLPENNRGHVYIAGWRMNALRDLSDDNDPFSGLSVKLDQTAVGLVLRLMQAGIKVRILLWLPPVGLISDYVDFPPHIDDHFYLVDTIQAENTRLKAVYTSISSPLGIVALDRRVADSSSSHHQKTIVIRVGSINIAYCGGVDLAFTRRDAPATGTIADNKFMQGDWQSGSDLSSALFSKDYAYRFSKDCDRTVNLESAITSPHPSHIQKADLPSNVYGTQYQIWHDQHLRLEGPIVSTLEYQFFERWKDGGIPYEVTPAKNGEKNKGRSNWKENQVYFSTNQAFEVTIDEKTKKQIKKIVDLDNPIPIKATPISDYNSLVQMWRTIPLRPKERKQSPFTRGEFTILSGISNACQHANELIWMFDQYFWDLPLARLLANRLSSTPSLHVIVVLPPYGDSDQVRDDQHLARAYALNALIARGVGNRVLVVNLWNHLRKIGIYCHAKSHTYDGNLLVCGSANLNRRSFLGDSELACAILDPSLVIQHQQRLWKLLMPPTALWPKLNGKDINLSNSGSGKLFFDAFRTELLKSVDANIPATMKPFMIPDFWRDTLTNQLPTEPPTKRDVVIPARLDVTYSNALESSSVDKKIEEETMRDEQLGIDKGVSLDEVVKRLEFTFEKGEKENSVQFTYRK